MNLGNRLSKLEAEYARDGGGLAGVTRSCKGLAWEDVLTAAGEAISEADVGVATRILNFAEEAARTPREAPSRDSRLWYEGCEDEKETHHFTVWLMGLQVGSWALPVPTIPRAVLDGFDSRHGSVLWRCEHCRTGLGNSARYGACPTCGAARDTISCKKLSGPPWDAPWVYTPLPRVYTPGRTEPWPPDSYPDHITPPADAGNQPKGESP